MKQRLILSKDKRIELNPKVMFGKPVIRGTRITVEHLLNLLEHGETVDAIVAEYPRLTEADVFAAIGFARSELTNSEYIA